MPAAQPGDRLGQRGVRIARVMPQTVGEGVGGGTVDHQLFDEDVERDGRIVEVVQFGGAGCEQLDGLGHRRVDQRSPRGEVPMDRARADPGPAGDLIERDRVGAVLEGQHGRGKDARPVRHRVGANG